MISLVNSKLHVVDWGLRIYVHRYFFPLFFKKVDNIR